MKIAFHSVKKHGTRNPAVLASVDGLPVAWDVRGWRCAYECPDDCPHIEAVAALLDPSVLGDWE